MCAPLTPPPLAAQLLVSQTSFARVQWLDIRDYRGNLLNPAINSIGIGYATFYDRVNFVVRAAYNSRHLFGMHCAVCCVVYDLRLFAQARG